MKKDLIKSYEILKNLFSEIGSECKNCNICCNTYGWLLKGEAKFYLKKGFSLAKINDKINCIDLFQRDKFGNVIMARIPQCRFYKKNRCLIQKIKPLSCRLYPLKIIFIKNEPTWVISTRCKYFSNLNPNEKKIFLNNVNWALEKLPPKIKKEYIDLMLDVSKISKKKRFPYKMIYQ